MTTDAMGCQKTIAREIIDADYVLALKGNHELVHEEMRSFLDAEITRQATPGKRRPRSVKAPGASPAPTFASVETVDKGHGRFEIRRYYQSTAIDWFQDRG